MFPNVSAVDFVIARSLGTTRLEPNYQDLKSVTDANQVGKDLS